MISNITDVPGIIKCHDMGLHREVARLCSRVDHWLRRIAIDFVAGTNHNPHKTVALPHRVPAARSVCLPGRGDGDLSVTQGVTIQGLR